MLIISKLIERMLIVGVPVKRMLIVSKLIDRMLIVGIFR